MAYPAVADAAARLASAIDAVPAWMLDFLRILVAGDSGPTGAVVDPMERGAACTDCGKARLPMLKMLSADERRLPNAAAKPPPLELRPRLTGCAATTREALFGSRYAPACVAASASKPAGCWYCAAPVSLSQ